jgi:hypothetical protein
VNTEPVADALKFDETEPLAETFTVALPEEVNEPVSEPLAGSSSRPDALALKVPDVEPVALIGAVVVPDADALNEALRLAVDDSTTTPVALAEKDAFRLAVALKIVTA